MKDFLRILFNAAVVQSLVLAVATGVLWVRSYSGNDQLVWQYRDFVPWKDLNELVHEKSSSLHLFSGQGGFAIDVILKDHDIYHPWTAQDLGLSQAVYHSSPPEYPRGPVGTQSWEWRGFGCSFTGRPTQLVADEVPALWRGITSSMFGVGPIHESVSMQIRFPAWFAMSLCMVLPAIWLIRNARPWRLSVFARVPSGR